MRAMHSTVGFSSRAYEIEAATERGGRSPYGDQQVPTAGVLVR